MPEVQCSVKTGIEPLHPLSPTVHYMGFSILFLTSNSLECKAQTGPDKQGQENEQAAVAKAAVERRRLSWRGRRQTTR